MKIQESGWRVAFSVASPVLLALFAWGALAVDAPLLISLLLAGLAVALGYVALYDFAIAVELGDEGIVRRCMLRRQLIRWDEAAAVAKPRKRGLLLVTQERKRLILVDRALEEGELERLRAELQGRGVRAEF